MSNDDPSRISPTAHYTSYVWHRNGLSHECLVTPFGRRLYRLLAVPNLAYSAILRQANLEHMLLARHRAIDHLLERAIESGAVGQVIEVAAGYSPRGLRFAQRYPDLVYVEGDLPAQAAAKREVLARAGLARPNHHVTAIDALAEDGPASLDAVATALLDPARGVAIVTEGLLNYFSRDDVEGMWGRFARCAARFPGGIYLSDLNVEDDVSRRYAARLFRFLLERFARGRVHLHYRDGNDAETSLQASGFDVARLHRPAELHDVDIPVRDREHLVRIIMAQQVQEVEVQEVQG
jgi:O-methyltransferase involved in polyketide biosynthesis